MKIEDKTDELYWHDLEFGYQNLAKLPMPSSPADRSSRNKRVICIYPSDHPYFVSYKEGIRRIASVYGVSVTFYSSEWDIAKFSFCIDLAISQKPDLLIYIPVTFTGNVPFLKKLYDAGIPVIASNLLLENDAFKYVLAWVGPDDWKQTRRFAHYIARDMNYKGSYCVISHKPGNSCYVSRTWAMITEMKKIAPAIKLLDVQTSFLDPDLTKILVSGWLDKFGSKLDCIFCAGDYLSQSAISSTLKERKATNVKTYFTGYAFESFQMVKDGEINGFLYQNAGMDGALAMQTAMDWIYGIDVAPVKYIQQSIVTKDNVQKFMANLETLTNLNTQVIYQALVDLDEESAEDYFNGIIEAVEKTSFVNNEIVSSINLEIWSSMVKAIIHFGFDVNSFVPEANIFLTSSMKERNADNSLQWLKTVALTIIADIKKKNSSKTVTDKVADFILGNYSTDMNINSLALQFSLSPAYLGQKFKEEKHILLNDFINETRLEHARILLKGTNLSEKEIAIKTGYSNINYFYRIFKKKEGLTPSQFRKS